jgi:hypothetical protein
MLLLQPSLESTIRRAYCSASVYDGSWVQIGPEVVIAGDLPLRGLATCSNSGFNADNARSYNPGTYSLFDFVVVRQGVNGAPPTNVDLNLLQALGDQHGRRALCSPSAGATTVGHKPPKNRPCAH